MTNAPPSGVKIFDSAAGSPNCGNQKSPARSLSKQKEAQGGFACLFWPSKRAPPTFFSLAGLYVCRWEVLINKNSSVARFIAGSAFCFWPAIWVSPSAELRDREAAHLHFYWAIKWAHSYRMLVVSVSPSGTFECLINWIIQRPKTPVYECCMWFNWIAGRGMKSAVQLKKSSSVCYRRFW